MIAICGNQYQDNHLHELTAFFNALRSLDIPFGVAPEFGAWLRSHGLDLSGVSEIPVCTSGLDLVLSFGGDGTFLHTASWVGASGVPVMGINTGHLGYLASFGFERPEQIRLALRGEYEISERMLLNVSGPDLPSGFNCNALNEIALLKGDTASMVDVGVWVGERHLAHYLGDGLLVSTPTGSTAYNLSCGGPILEPTLEAMILTPVAPHSLTLRPLVLGADRELLLEVESRGPECLVSVDGRTFAVPPEGTRLTVARAPYRLRVAQPPATAFGAVLRRKLNWNA